MMTAFERDAIIAALIGTGGPWDPTAVFVGVALSVTDHGIATVIGDVVPAPTSLAVRQAVGAWTGPHIKTDGRAMVDSPALTFAPASSGDAASIGAYFVADALTAGNLLFFNNMGTPINLPDATTSMSIVLRLTIDPENGKWEASIVFNG